ncbi:hypothetical protein SLS62_004013 [Diatrype stigma]|uniref:Zinc finger protein n=1 Tax=Diatrype stigma TaxID=117547 RepID=A0AAN9URV2_9PEZI
MLFWQMAPKKPTDDRGKKPGKTGKSSKGVSKAKKASPRYYPTNHKGRYVKKGRWFCQDCNALMAGTKKTIFWHGQKKHNAGSTYAKDQMAGSKVGCSHKGCKSMTSTANSYLQHHRSAHKFKGSSAGLKSEFRKKQAAADKKNAAHDSSSSSESSSSSGDSSSSSGDSSSSSEADTDDEYDEPMDSGDDYLSEDSDEDDEPGAGAGAAAGAPLPIAAA